MSFLSNVWNKASSDQDQTHQQGEPEPAQSRKSNKTAFTEVKLPSIPIDFSDNPGRGVTPVIRSNTGAGRSRSRYVESGDRSKCIFCGNHSCQATSNDTCINKHPQVLGQKQTRRRTKIRQDIVDNTKLSKEVTRRASHTTSPYFDHDHDKVDSHVGRMERSSPRESPSKTVEGWEPFSSLCQHCGLKFGRHSIAIHERRCHGKQQHIHVHKNEIKLQTSLQDNAHSGDGGLQKVATIVTIGLSSGIEKTTVYADLPPRPQTRTVKHSILHSSGHGVPLAGDLTLNDAKLQDSSSSVLCEHCEHMVAADRISVHKRLCKPKLPLVSAGNVTFPSACDLLRIEENSTKKDISKSPRQPPTKVCYICGREFGSRSIDIHEPQCMKKWRVENRKLPIGDRKPVPKKPESKPTIARALSTTDSLRPIKSLPANGYEDGDNTDDIVQRYYMKCYSEFEQDLVPCKKCGRTFVPERHRQHEQHCNAKRVNSKKLNAQRT